MRTALFWLRVLQLPEGCDRCVACGRRLPAVAAGDIVAAFCAGQELLSLLGDCCLTAEARAELARLRAEAATERCRR